MWLFAADPTSEKVTYQDLALVLELPC
jgi:hypothetical protein